MNGRLIVHLKDEHTMETWSAFLVLDTDVTDFNSYDGEVNTKTGKSFKITPKAWNAEIKEGQRRMIGFTFKWPQDTNTPKLVALTVNGIPYTCIEGGMYTLYYFSTTYIQNYKHSQSSDIRNRFCDFCWQTCAGARWSENKDDKNLMAFI